MQNSKTRGLLWGAVFAVLVASVYIIIVLSASQKTVVIANEISKDDWTQGNKNAKVTLIEYSDFQCPACAMFSPIVQNIVNEFQDHMVFVYRYFPLKSIHKNAVSSSIACEAAGKQGKFWEMHDLIFNGQKDWEEQTLINANEIYTSYAKSLNIDIDKFKKDLENKQIADKVESQYQSAQDAGLNSTPTFFLNGTKIENPRTLDAFRSLIRNAIEKTAV